MFLDQTTIGILLLVVRVISLAVVAPMLKTLNRGQNHAAATLGFCLLGAAYLVPVVVYQASNTPGYFDGISGYIDNSLITAGAFAIGMVIFMWALKRGDVNLLTPLLALTMVFIYVFDLLRGIVAPSWGSALGIGLVVLGIPLLNVNGKERWREIFHPLRILKQPGAIGAIAYAFALAITRVFDSEVADQAPAMLYALFGNSFVVGYCLIIILVTRKLDSIGKLFREKGVMLVWFSIIGIINYTTLLYLYDHYAPSVIEPVCQLSIVGAVFLGTWLYKEPLHLRWLAAILVAAGASIVFIYR